MQIKVLITGSNGDLACSIAKIIKKHFKNSKIIGTDLTKNGIGELIFNKIYKVPPANHKNYGRFINRLSKKVDLIIPATDIENKFFCKNSKKYKSKVLINDNRVIDLFSEKYKTQKYLIQNFKDLALDYCILLKDFYRYKKKIKTPFFLKKNIGSGNKNYQIIKNKKEVKMLKNFNKNDWVIEELLKENADEFTCALIRLKKFKKIIIFKRKLHKLGYTLYAETYKNSKIEKKIFKIADAVNLNGCINIQFKIIKNKIKIFDINPRLSSTVRMRDILGFQDCLWWIKDKLNLKINKKIVILKNKRIAKDFEEKLIN